MQSSILSAPHAPEFVARPARLAGRPQRLVVVSSRADPCAGLHEDASTRTIRDALAEHGGVWLGWSGRVDDARMFHVRREGRIRCVAGDLSAEEHRLGYAGYAARTLWPLLHGRLDLVAFDREWLRGYRQINERFADSVARLTEPGDLVWIHDHHLIPLGRALRDRGIDAAIGFFLHAPVPPPETLAALPEHARLFPLLEACDVVGVQTAGDARHLKDYLQSRVARMPRIEVCPAGIDVAAATALAEEAAARPRADAPRLRHGGRHPAILERAGRVVSLVLDAEPLHAGVRGERGSLEKRCVPLGMRDDLPLARAGDHELPVAPHPRARLGACSVPVAQPRVEQGTQLGAARARVVDHDVEQPAAGRAGGVRGALVERRTAAGAAQSHRGVDRHTHGISHRAPVSSIVVTRAAQSTPARA